MTVSRVLNYPQLVAEPTRERVQASIRELDYLVNDLAQPLGKPRRPVIGILALNVATTPYSVSITFAVEQLAREQGWRTYLINTFSDNPPANVLDSLLSLRPEGVVFATMGHRIVNVPERLIRAGVVLANCQTSQKGVACYVPDDEQGQYEGVLKLLEQGYRRPICIHLPEGSPAGSLRRKGIQRAFKDFNIAEKDQVHVVLSPKPESIQPVQFHDEPDFLQTVSFLDDALSRRSRPDCVICANDRVALVAYQYLLSRGLRIPQDVGVLGFDDMVGVGGLFLPPLSTIRLPHEEIGRAAASHVILKRKKGGIYRVKCPFVSRASF
ncbi:MAG: LacI family DNA-binding transcriptional regulator [Verrucomicrobia bacterium]|nr:LacI family DNA-binding transcriptional regulator [Verrucomicrobiota bacterium]